MEIPAKSENCDTDVESSSSTPATCSSHSDSNASNITPKKLATIVIPNDKGGKPGINVLFPTTRDNFLSQAPVQVAYRQFVSINGCEAMKVFVTCKCHEVNQIVVEYCPKF